MLRNLSTEARNLVLKLHLENCSLNYCVSAVESATQEQVSASSLSRYFRSEEGVEALKAMRTTLVEEWKVEPLVEKFSRVHALVEQAGKLQRYLRVLDPQDKLWASLSGDFRAYLKQIREELDPLKLEISGRQLSPFEQLDLRLKEEFGEEYAKALDP